MMGPDLAGVRGERQRRVGARTSRTTVGDAADLRSTRMGVLARSGTTRTDPRW